MGAHYNPNHWPPSPPYQMAHLTFVNSTFGGVEVQQNWTALFLLGKFLEEEKIEYVIELGTAKGGLTKFFRNYCETDTFDLPDDVFMPSMIYFISELIYLHKKTLVFCDNGHKPREITIYGQELKKGDYIMAHDYLRPDGISLADINYRRLGLQLYRQSEFDDLETSILSFRKV